MKYFYLIHVQYLGFRFHGWAKQPNVKTVHQFIDKTLPFVLGHKNFKTLGSSRTDAMVSANHAIFELFIDEALDIEYFFREFNRNLPSDIRIIKIEETDADFNVIQSPKIEGVHLPLCFWRKSSPVCCVDSWRHSWKTWTSNVMIEGALHFPGEDTISENTAQSPVIKLCLKERSR
jgi:tRNA pseudouridine38-40 synthase